MKSVAAIAALLSFAAAAPQAYIYTKTEWYTATSYVTSTATATSYRTITANDCAPTSTAVATSTLVPAPVNNGNNGGDTIVTLRLDVDLASAGSITREIPLNVAFDENIQLQGAQIQSVEGGNVDPGAVVCQALRDSSSTVAGTFTLEEAAVFDGGNDVTITQLSCSA